MNRRDTSKVIDDDQGPFRLDWSRAVVRRPRTVTTMMERLSGADQLEMDLEAEAVLDREMGCFDSSGRFRARALQESFDHCRALIRRCYERGLEGDLESITDSEIQELLEAMSSAWRAGDTKRQEDEELKRHGKRS